MDIDWSDDKVDWAKAAPMDAEEVMLRDLQAVKAVDNTTVTWLYRNGCKALPWFTTVRRKLEDRAHWGWFVAKPGCKVDSEYLLRGNMYT